MASEQQGEKVFMAGLQRNSQMSCVCKNLRHNLIKLPMRSTIQRVTTPISTLLRKKGYSGVGIYSLAEPENVQEGLGWKDFDSEGRYLQVDYPDLSIVSLYMPSGSSKEERQDFKYVVMDRFESVLKEMQKQDREWIICGDWNIAHKKIDIKNWRGNQKNSGFLPEERAWMDWLFDEAGFVDAFRAVDDREEQYTWWSNRGQAWANNTGWRIDYHVVTPGLAQKVVRANIYKEERFSDHAPLTLEYDI